MAFRGVAKRKEIKKSSYYVWFLGAKESRGLRGEEYIHPAIRYLVEREGEVEPLKVTLQVSSKGLKIIQQNVSTSSPPITKGSGHRHQQSSSPNSKGIGGGGGQQRTETTKHFIPDHSITCVTQHAKPHDDVVACILLLYNPVSKCPVHVHGYRCDSVETATVLRQHLQVLIDRPENQRKFTELEVRLQAKGLMPKPSEKTAHHHSGSDGRSSKTESDSSGGASSTSGRGGGPSDRNDIYTLDERMSNLYDSLAAELREKLNNNRNHGPLLLPPRDYDTVHRMRGKLEDIDNRRCLQYGIVGKKGNGGTARSNGTTHVGSKHGPSETTNTKNMPVTSGLGHPHHGTDSSGKSSGIGSDEAPSSPTHERGGGRANSGHGDHHPIVASKKKKTLNDDQSSSDEEWQAHQDPQATTEGDMILVQSPRTARRTLSGGGKGPTTTTERGQYGRTPREEATIMAKPQLRSMSSPPVSPSNAIPPSYHRPKSPPFDDKTYHYSGTGERKADSSSPHHSGGHHQKSVPFHSMERKGIVYTSSPVGLYVDDELPHGNRKFSGRPFADHSLDHQDHDRGGGRGGTATKLSSKNDPDVPIDYANSVEDGPFDQVARPLPIALHRVRSREERSTDPSALSRSLERDTGYASSREPLNGSREVLSRQSPASSASPPHASSPRLSNGIEPCSERHSVSSRWPATPSYAEQRERTRVTSSPLSPTSPQSTPPSTGLGGKSRVCPPDYDKPYVPLPRIRSLLTDSSSHHHPVPSASHQHCHASIPSQTTAYQELPEDKRYPGLDRDTARIPHYQYANGLKSSGMRVGTDGPTPSSAQFPGSTVRKQRSPPTRADYERPDYARRQEASRDYRESTGRHDASSRHQAAPRTASKSQMTNGPPGGASAAQTLESHYTPAGGRQLIGPERFRTASAEAPPMMMMALPNRRNKDANSGDSVDRRFYRYSSPDTDYRLSGHRISNVAPSGFHY